MAAPRHLASPDLSSQVDFTRWREEDESEEEGGDDGGMPGMGGMGGMEQMMAQMVGQ